MTNIVPLRNTGGFTRMDNQLIDGLMAIDLPGRELKVALYIAKATLNFQAGSVRIKATDVSKATNLHPDVASKAIAHLLKRRVIFREGGSRGDIGMCDPKEWIYYECPSQTNRSDSDHSGAVVSIASQTNRSDSLLYSKNKPLVTVSTKQITAPQGAEPTQDEKPKLVSFDGEDFEVDPALIAKWAQTYSPIEVESEIKRAAAWASGSKPKKDWRRFLVNWLGREFKRNPNGASEKGVPVDKIIELYHRTCPNLPAVAVANDRTLRSMIAERWNESETHQGSEFWKIVFNRANRMAQVYHRGANVTPRLEVICSRPVFRQLEEQQ